MLMDEGYDEELKDNAGKTAGDYTSVSSRIKTRWNIPSSAIGIVFFFFLEQNPSA